MISVSWEKRADKLLASVTCLKTQYEDLIAILEFG